MRTHAQVVEAATDDYPEVHDLLSRFRTLRAAHADLTAAQARSEGAAGALREECAAYVKARANELLDGNNQLSGLQRELERGAREAYLVQASVYYDCCPVRMCLESFLLSVACRLT
jgi:hypothetical protein